MICNILMKLQNLWLKFHKSIKKCMDWWTYVSHIKGNYEMDSNVGILYD